MNNNDHPMHPQTTPGFWRSRAGMALIAFLAVAGLLLVYEHRVHIFTGDALLIALLLLCIGMHLFMHGGHGGHGRHGGGGDRQ
jgi:Na+/glutamate symporter